MYELLQQLALVLDAGCDEIISSMCFQPPSVSRLSLLSISVRNAHNYLDPFSCILFYSCNPSYNLMSDDQRPFESKMILLH